MPEEPLTTLAEIAIAVVGFSGVILALRTRITSDDRYRILLIVILSLITIVCSLIPFVVGSYTDSPELVWGIPLGIFGASSVSNASYTWVKIQRGSLKAYNTVFTIVSLGSGVVFGLVALGSVASVGLEPTHGLLSFFMLYVVSVLIIAFLNALLFITREQSEVDEGNEDT